VRIIDVSAKRNKVKSRTIGEAPRARRIELELPRNLTCAACEGGGCDACDRSGAITMRERGDPPALVLVTLRASDRDGTFLVRLPEHGGRAEADSSLPRGHLLLRVQPSGQADPGVKRTHSAAAIERVQSGVRVARPSAHGGLWLVGGALLFGLALVIWTFLAPR
jgi:hypothetical protein